MDINLYNTLTHKKEKFVPVKNNEVSVYSCGPTVYSYAHIGNMRTYLFVDSLRRMFKYNGYNLNHVMNITDVGHLVSDADEGVSVTPLLFEHDAVPMSKTALMTTAINLAFLIWLPLFPDFKNYIICLITALSYNRINNTLENKEA